MYKVNVCHVIAVDIQYQTVLLYILLWIEKKL